MAKVAVVHGSFRRIGVDNAGVGVLTLNSNAVAGTGHHAANGQAALRATDRYALGVGHYDVLECDIANIGNDIGPVDRISHGDIRTGRRVGIFTVGVLLNVDRRYAATVEESTVLSGLRIGRVARTAEAFDIGNVFHAAQLLATGR